MTAKVARTSAGYAVSGVLLPRPSPPRGPPEVVSSARIETGALLSFPTPFLASESLPFPWKNRHEDVVRPSSVSLRVVGC